MKPLVLVFGQSGQVARALQRTQPESFQAEYLGRDAADLTRPERLIEIIRERFPAVVIVAAAYTAVDLAEKEAEAAELVNALAPEAIAKACTEVGAALIYYSTDYVFDGSGETARTESEAVAPLSVYGRTKEMGEARVRASCLQHIILRTSWVYDAEGKNFVRTMLKLGAERENLRVVSDQVGAPTAAVEIARASWKIAERAVMDEAAWGTYHLVAQGETSWRGFAEAIFEDARALGFPLQVREVQPIPTSEYPTPARRPLSSRLSTEKVKRAFGIELPEWRVSLRECLAEIKGNQT